VPHTYTNLKYHLIFGTKQRGPWIVQPLRDALYGYMGGIIQRQGGMSLAIGGVADHVHILAGFPPTVPVSEMLRRIKANASAWVNQRPDQEDMFAWQVGYGAFTVSQSQVAAVERYIQRQEEHHRHVSFEDEMKALVQRHGIPWEG